MAQKHVLTLGGAEIEVPLDPPAAAEKPGNGQAAEAVREPDDLNPTVDPQVDGEVVEVPAEKPAKKKKGKKKKRKKRQKAEELRDEYRPVLDRPTIGGRLQRLAAATAVVVALPLAIAADTAVELSRRVSGRRR